MNKYTIEVLLNKIESSVQSREKLELIIDTIIELGYDGLLTDRNGVTPLIYTVKYDYKELTKRLLDHYKDFNIKDTIFSKSVHIEHTVGNSIFDEVSCASSNLIKMVNKHDRDDHSALDYAIYNKDYDIACTLILHGADISSLNMQEQKSLLLYSDDKVYSNASAIEDHELRPIVGLLAIKVPTAVADYSVDYSYPRLLSYFCWHGHSKVVASLINSIQDDNKKKLIINKADNGYTPLDRANNNTKLSDYDHMQMIKYLFEQGATNPFNKADPTFGTLGSAARQGHIETFKYLAEKADKKHFNTYIGLATIDYHINIIEYIWNNYREYTVDRQGNTALHYAAWRGNLQSIKYLCKNGGDINSTNKHGETPLDNAIEFKREDVIRYLINEYDAYVGLESNRIRYMSMRKLLCVAHNDINTSTDQFGNTPLHDAIKSCDIISTKHLITQGVDINRHNVLGITPLHLAVQNIDSSFTKLLLIHGVIYNSVTKDNNTALVLSKGRSKEMLTIINDLFYSTNLLQDLDQTINALTSYNDAYDSNNPMIFLINVKDNNGQTLLHRAVMLNDKDAIKLILKYNQSYIEINNTIKLPYAEDYVPIDISLQDLNGNTPLHLAAHNGNIEIIGMLINENANINVKNHFGHTPIFVAGQYGHKDIVAFLVKTLHPPETVKVDSRTTTDIKHLTSQVKEDLGIEEKNCSLNKILDKSSSSINNYPNEQELLIYNRIVTQFKKIEKKISNNCDNAEIEINLTGIDISILETYCQSILSVNANDLVFEKYKCWISLNKESIQILRHKLLS